MWWQDAVVYQVYPRSFADGDGDGVGDLSGLRQRLDHLAWLGVDAVWLSPIYRSPMADFGYDVSDHCDVDPVFGTLADADALVADAHALGIKVLLDWVPNHTSIEHRWWTERPDFYVWRDGDPARPPNNWVRAFPFPPPLPAWTFHVGSARWYLHLFLPEQPDVDWSNPELEAAMHDVLRFWLDRGIDGFRADVIHAIGKDPALPDDPAEVAGIPHSSLHEDPRTHGLLRGIRGVLDSYSRDGADRMMVGEVYLTGERITERTATYVGADRLHLAFDFSPVFSRWGDPERWRRRIARIDGAYQGDGRWPTWVLSNHDNARHRTRYGSEAAARAAAVLLLGVRGTPFLYAGEELGLEDAVVPPERIVDPGGRDGCRAPIPWTASAPHGWPADPWLPFPPEAGARSVAAQRNDPASMLWLYKRLLAARKASPALRRGDLRLLDADVLAWERVDPATGDRRAVLVDVGGDGGAVPAGVAGWTVEVASDGPDGEGQPLDHALAPGRAVVLHPF
jgi:alpha-glucosidase